MAGKPHHERLEEWIRQLEEEVAELKRAEETLRIEKAYFEHLLDSAPEAIVLADKDHRITRTNAQFSHLFDYTPEETIGRSCDELIAPAERLNEASDITLRVGHGEVIRLETARSRKDGSPVFVELMAAPVRVGDEHIGDYVSYRDVTERKQAEDALRESETLLTKSQEIAHVGSWEFDLEGDRLIWSDEVYRIFGLEPSEFKVTYEAFLDAVHPEDRTAVDATYSSSLREGKDDYEIEHRVIHKRTGEVRYVHEKCFHVRDTSGRIVRSVGMVQDITDRKRAEEKATRFSRILEDSLNEIYIFDADTFHFIEVNRGARQNLGYSMEELRGLTPVDLKPEFTNESFEELIEPLRTGVKEIVQFNTVHRRKDGTQYPIEVHLQIMQGDPPLFIAIILDITERKKGEDRLRESEARFREMADLLPQSVYETDAQGLLTYANRYVFDLFGYTKEEFEQGLSVFQMLIPEDRDRAADAFRSLLTENPPNPERGYRALRKDGTSFPIEIYSSPMIHEGTTVGMRGILVDMTEREKAEEANLENAERLRAFFSSINDAIFVHPLKEEGFAPFIEVNDVACERYGYSREEFLQLTAFDIAEKSVAEKHIRSEDRSELLEKGHAIFEILHIKKSGETFPVEINANIVYQHGNPYIMTVARDITERMKVEQEQRVLQKRLIQAQKMEAIGTLAGGIAHDFNNILSGIIGYTQLALKGAQDNPSIRRMLERVLKAGDRATDLVKQILAFSRSQDHEDRPISPAIIAKEVLKLIRASLPSTIKIRQSINSESIIKADPTKIHQVLMNLCTNAAHSMSENGGILEVTLKDEHLGPDDMSGFTDLTPGYYLRLSVKDTGSGISHDIMDKIFEPYFTTKGLSEGTGMGLSVVHGIVKNYGGSISVESEVGKGSRFHVLLPLIDMEAPLTSKTETHLPRGNEHALIVDDEKEMVDMIRLMLEDLGYKVTARTSSIDALEAFRNEPEKYDFVVTDMTMPNMTGKDLAKELIDIRPDIPIILCTGFSHRIDENSAKAMGITAFVMKPLVMSEMAKKIREILDKKHSTKR